jgi:thiamine biosynthesis lipoprotein
MNEPASAATWQDSPPLERENLLQRCKPLLGTYVKIDVVDSVSRQALHDLTDTAYAQMAKVQELMSFHDTASELSRINAQAHLKPVGIHPWTMDVLREAQRFSALSQGVFDVTIASTLVKWRLLPRRRPKFSGEERGNWQDIILHGGCVSFRQPLQIDLGGIAKGYAVDRAAVLLQEAGVKRATIDAGGDIRFVGARPPGLAVRDPAFPWKGVVSVPVRGAAVATSAGYFASRGHLWWRVSHILNPITRRSFNSRSSATVFAPTCTQADAIAKIVLLGDPAQWKAWLGRENAVAMLSCHNQALQTFEFAGSDHVAQGGIQ